MLAEMQTQKEALCTAGPAFQVTMEAPQEPTHRPTHGSAILHPSLYPNDAKIIHH